MHIATLASAHSALLGLAATLGGLFSLLPSSVPDGVSTPRHQDTPEVVTTGCPKPSAMMKWLIQPCEDWIEEAEPDGTGPARFAVGFLVQEVRHWGLKCPCTAQWPPMGCDGVDYTFYEFVPIIVERDGSGNYGFMNDELAIAMSSPSRGELWYTANARFVFDPTASSPENDVMSQHIKSQGAAKKAWLGGVPAGKFGTPASPNPPIRTGPRTIVFTDPPPGFGNLGVALPTRTVHLNWLCCPNCPKWRYGEAIP